MSYTIKRVVVIGSGTMGGGIAAHAANAGLPVSLLDIAPQRLTPEEEKRGLTLSHAQVRNRIVVASLEREAFVSLCGEPKTIERIMHMLKTGKPLRN